MDKTKKNYGNQWERVKGDDLHAFNKDKAKKNKSTMNNKIFKESCEYINLEITKRQASKWNNKKGLAYKSQMKKV